VNCKIKNKTMQGSCGKENNGELSRLSDPAVLLMRYIVYCSIILSCVFVVAGWLWYDWYFARSVLIGAVLVNLSFYLLKRDIEQIANRIADGSSGTETIRRIDKIKFFIKFYARLAVLGLLIFIAVAKIGVNMVGLLVGLSIIVFSIIIVGVVKGHKIYSLQQEGV